MSQWTTAILVSVTGVHALACRVGAAEDLAYKHAWTKGKILRCDDINRVGTMQLLYDKLKTLGRRVPN